MSPDILEDVEVVDLAGDENLTPRRSREKDQICKRQQNAELEIDMSLMMILSNS